MKKYKFLILAESNLILDFVEIEDKQWNRVRNSEEAKIVVVECVHEKAYMNTLTIDGYEFIKDVNGYLYHTNWILNKEDLARMME